MEKDKNQEIDGQHSECHGDSCGCGHEHHDHEHEEESCGCGHEHHEHDHAASVDDSFSKAVFIVENLDCANCAAKMEHRINELPEVGEATLTFATKQLRVSAKDPMALLPKLQEICASIESEAQVVPRQKRTAKKSVTKIYTVENLDCANCAAKMERLINEMDGVEEASVTFATKQLRLVAEHPDELLPQITENCRKIEGEVSFKEKEDRRKTASAEKETASKNSAFWEKYHDLIAIIAGAVLFIGVEVFNKVSGAESFSTVMIGACVLAYLILGGRVVWTAVKNLFKGQVFDENFLMSIATLGAFVIGEYPEAVGVMLFFRVGEYFEHVAVERSRSQIMEAVDLRPEVVNLVEGDDVRVVDAQDVTVGSYVMVRPGDRVPLDGVVVEGESRLDTSAVTGEPVPVKVGVGSEVISGCVNTSGLLKVRVEKVLEESMVTRILDAVENAAASKPKIDNFITRFARVYTPVVVLIAAFTAIGMPLITGSAFYPWVYTALSFLVMSCPCALVLSVPLAFFCGIGSGSKRGILFKGGVALEALSSVKAVVMDKTGTITKGDFSVQKVLPYGKISKDELLKMAAACELSSTHPIGVSIVAACKKEGYEVIRPERIEEISGQGIKAVIGKKVVLCGNMKLMESFGIDMSAYEKVDVGSEVIVAADGVYAGQLVIADTVKEEAKEAIEGIKHQGIKTAMLTGDAKDSADAVAEAAGVEEVHAKLLPEQKVSELLKIREHYGSVMFVGDGINDAPVLAGADVGAAMGSGADAAIEAADVVFMNSNLDAVGTSIAIAKHTTSIAKQNVIFALAIKIAVMILGLTGIYSNMWLAVFADTGVAFLCILNSIRILSAKRK